MDCDVELVAAGVRGPQRLGSVIVYCDATEADLPPGSKILYRRTVHVMERVVLREQLLVASPDFEPIDSGAEAPEYVVRREGGVLKYVPAAQVVP